MRNYSREEEVGILFENAAEHDVRCFTIILDSGCRSFARFDCSLRVDAELVRQHRVDALHYRLVHKFALPCLLIETS